MNGWLDWREIEKQNDWGVRNKNDATAELWNQAADGWNRRSPQEDEFNRLQVDAMEISPEDTVIDICCGAGPLTIWLARRAKHVIAFDYGDKMLEHVRRRAEEAGLTNISYLQGNWHSMEPGKDFPEADIAVTRHSPAHSNILKFSKCAAKYCYSLWNCAGYHAGRDRSTMPGPPGMENRRRPQGRWIKSDNPEENYGPRPDGRKYGYNVHFNLLYDWGADPEIRIIKDANGMRRMALMGWDPNTIHFEDIDPESIR